MYTHTFQDQFGEHDYGLSASSMPESDKPAWNSTNDPKYVPPRDVLQTVMSLKAVKVCILYVYVCMYVCMYVCTPNMCLLETCFRP